MIRFLFIPKSEPALFLSEMASCLRDTPVNLPPSDRVDSSAMPVNDRPLTARNEGAVSQSLISELEAAIAARDLIPSRPATAFTRG
ncbi:Tfp pilus assembly ATPase PilU [Bradyrhizobium elkanii]